MRMLEGMLGIFAIVGGLLAVRGGPFAVSGGLLAVSGGLRPDSGGELASFPGTIMRDVHRLFELSGGEVAGCRCAVAGLRRQISQAGSAVATFSRLAAAGGLLQPGDRRGVPAQRRSFAGPARHLSGSLNISVHAASCREVSVGGSLVPGGSALIEVGLELIAV